MDVRRSHDGIRNWKEIPVLKKILVSAVAVAATTLGVVGVAHADTLGDHGFSNTRGSDDRGSSSYDSDSDSDRNDSDSDYDSDYDYDNDSDYDNDYDNDRDSGITNGLTGGSNNNGSDGLLGGLGN